MRGKEEVGLDETEETFKASLKNNWDDLSNNN